MRAGLLRHRVTIQSKTNTRTAHGEMEESWSAVATVWANVRPVKSDEAMEAERTITRRTHEVKMRTDSAPTITADMRLLFGSRYLYVLGPPRDMDERGIHIVLDCKETV